MTPLRLGDLSYVWMVQHEWRVSLDRATRSLIWMRWQDATVLGAIAVLLLVPLDATVRTLMAAAWVFVATVALPRLAIGLMAGRPGLRLWRQAVAERGADLDGWIACACYWLVRLCVVGWLLLLITGQGDLDALRAAAGTELAGLLPLQGPAGLGTYEGGAWLGAMLSGANATAFVGAALVVHVFCALLLLAAAVAAYPGPSETTTRLGSAR